jgi:hypothetical protein
MSKTMILIMSTSIGSIPRLCQIFLASTQPNLTTLTGAMLVRRQLALRARRLSRGGIEYYTV